MRDEGTTNSHECRFTDCVDCDGYVGDADYECKCKCHLDE